MSIPRAFLRLFLSSVPISSSNISSIPYSKTKVRIKHSWILYNRDFLPRRKITTAMSCERAFDNGGDWTAVTQENIQNKLLRNKARKGVSSQLIRNTWQDPNFILKGISHFPYLPGYKFFRLHNFRTDQHRLTILGGHLFITRNRLTITVSRSVLGNIGNKRREYANIKNVSDLLSGLANQKTVNVLLIVRVSLQEQRKCT